MINADAAKKKVTVKVPGSCGELVQGVIEGTPFLVTCPIDIYASAIVLRGKDMTTLPEKAARAVRAFCAKAAVSSENICTKLTSQLVKSKGMASSSADIAAVCKAAALYYNVNLTEKDTAELAAAIEPTDGIFCRGIVKFNHLTGEILEYLGEPPAVQMALFDCGGSVDTIVFNQRGELPYLNAQKEPQVKKALELISRGIKYHDAKVLGEGATISAVANQKILYKEDLADIINISKKYGSIGVNIAHSGTLIGIMFDENAAGQMPECIKAVQLYCPYTNYLYSARLISGGFFNAAGARLT